MKHQWYMSIGQMPRTLTTQLSFAISHAVQTTLYLFIPRTDSELLVQTKHLHCPPNIIGRVLWKIHGQGPAKAVDISYPKLAGSEVFALRPSKCRYRTAHASASLLQKATYSDPEHRWRGYDVKSRLLLNIKWFASGNSYLRLASGMESSGILVRIKS